MEHWNEKNWQMNWTPKWTFYGIYLPCQFSRWSLNFLKIRLKSRQKWEYLNHLYSEFQFKNNKLIKCAIAQEKCYKWHKMKSENNNATNDQIGLVMLFNSSHVLMLPFHNTVITRVLVSRTRIWHSWKFKMLKFHPAYLVSVCSVNSHSAYLVSFCTVNSK